MTAPLLSGQSLASAWPDAHAISRTSDHVAFASGTLTCVNVTFAGLREHVRHVAQETANAVGVHAPPGFKSPSLRF